MLSQTSSVQVATLKQNQPESSPSLHSEGTETHWISPLDSAGTAKASFLY